MNEQTNIETNKQMNQETNKTNDKEKQDGILIVISIEFSNNFLLLTSVLVKNT